jgi:hypothetical protein
MAGAYALTDRQLRSAWNHVCDDKAGETRSERYIDFPKDTQPPRELFCPDLLLAFSYTSPAAVLSTAQSLGVESVR